MADIRVVVDVNVGCVAGVNAEFGVEHDDMVLLLLVVVVVVVVMLRVLLLLLCGVVVLR